MLIASIKFIPTVNVVNGRGRRTTTTLIVKEDILCLQTQGRSALTPYI